MVPGHKEIEHVTSIINKSKKIISKQIQIMEIRAYQMWIEMLYKLARMDTNDKNT